MWRKIEVALIACAVGWMIFVFGMSYGQYLIIHEKALLCAPAGDYHGNRI